MQDQEQPSKETRTRLERKQIFEQKQFDETSNNRSAT